MTIILDGTEKMKKIFSLMLSVTAISWLTTSVAGDTFDSSGTVANKDSTQMIPIDENQIVIKSNNQGTISTKDPASPTNGATGSCSGTMLLSMGKLSGGGYCTYKDGDGDTSIVSFTATGLNDKGGNSGRWMMVGGTGKYLGATGGGEYSAIPNEDRTESQNTITGEIRLK